MIYWALWKTGESYRPAHWPGKWAAISLNILGKKRRKSSRKPKGEGRRNTGIIKKKSSILAWGRNDGQKSSFPRPWRGRNQPGQHFTCVASCWPQREERGCSVAWRGGQRGRGPVTLTHEVMRQANEQKQAHIHYRPSKTRGIPVKGSVTEAESFWEKRNTWEEVASWKKSETSCELSASYCCMWAMTRKHMTLSYSS